MAISTFRGVDCRQSGDRLLFRAFLQDSSGAKIITGTASLYLFELQADGSLKSFDFSDFTFKTGALTTASGSMTHRTGNNSTFSTGLWTYSLTSISGFTKGGVYFAQVSHSSASPTEQTREFQFGAVEGDLNVTASGNPVAVNDLAPPAAWNTDVVQSGDAYARIGAAGVGLTGVGLAAAQRVKLDAVQPDYVPAKAGDSMALTPAERIATANEVEAQIIDETDTEKVLTAITNKIASANPDLSGLTLSAIAAAVRTEVERVGSPLLGVKAKTDSLNFTGTDVKATLDGETVALTAGHGLGLETTLTAMKGSGWTAEGLKQIYDQVGLRLLTSVYVAPDNAGIGTAATQASLAAGSAGGANTKAAIIQVVTDKLGQMIETDAGDFRFDLKSLELAPTGPNLGQAGIAFHLQDDLGAPIPGLLVTIWNSPQTAIIGYDITDSAGDTGAFGLDPASYKVVVGSGVLHDPIPVQSLTVTVNTTVTYELARRMATPVTPGLSVGQITILNEGFAPTIGTLQFRMLKPPSSESGVAYLKDFTATSGSDGLLEVPVPAGSQYHVRRGSGPWVVIDIPVTSPFNLPDILGIP